MKRGLFLFLTLCALACYAQVNEEEIYGKPYETGGLKYRLFEDRHEAVVDNANTWAGELDISEEINVNGQAYPVTAISWLAFDYCETLTKVRIPKTIRKVFITTGGAECNRNPFRGCSNLVSIEVAADNPAFCSVEGVLYDKEMTALCSYPVGAKRQSYTVPDGIKTICGGAFQDCPYLVSIQLPQTISKICGSAFALCEHLETVNLPAGINHLAAALFRDCVSLKDVVIPDGVKTMGEQTFFGCTSLRKIEVPASVYLIGGLAFRGCTLDALLIRGHISENLTKDVFAGLNVSTPLYVPAAEVARYQSVYSGTVLPLDSYQAKISVPDLSTGHSLLYDLEGRQLQGRPAKGLYIENGRKRVVK